MAIPINRPSIEEVIIKVNRIININILWPKNKNKGSPGHLLERIVGIPNSSDSLDCIDGELKSFKVKKYRNGTFAPDQTIACTMINNTELTTKCFAESKCYKKLSKVLYVPYYRNGDYITFMKPTLIDINIEKYKTLKTHFEADYNTIRDYYLTNTTLDNSSGISKYIQNRTKGRGGNTPKTRAFYLKTDFIKDFIPLNI
jgi:hypothetical protein